MDNLNSSIDFKIQKGVNQPHAWGEKYPFKRMEVGDSFWVDADVSCTVCAAARTVARRTNLKFRSKSENGGHRIWRTA